MNKFLALFRKAGGIGLIRQYRKSHVLLFALLQMLCHGFSKKSLEIVRLAVSNKVVGKLRRKYRKHILGFQYSPEKGENSKKVWVCWLQGMENAPALVQACYASLQKHMSDREIVVLTEENYRNHVTFPEHVQQKIDTGIITRTHFSDLLRLELLCTYGGTWIDATVLLTGEVPEYMLDSDLFVFQNLKPGLDGHATAISSWFMTGCTGNPIIQLTRHLLYCYWETHNALIDYFLIHDFFQLAIETHPDVWHKVVPFSNATPHILLLRLFEPYDEPTWNIVQNMTSIHKLSYKFKNEETLKEGTYYKALFPQ